MNALDVTTEIIISAPRQKTAEWASNPDFAPEWYANIHFAQWKTSRPLAVGSQFLFEAHFLGKKLRYTYEVVEFIPEQKLSMRTADGPFPMETTYTWESLDSQTTRMILRNRGNPAGFSRLFRPFMAFAVKKANQKDLKQLKYLLENS